MQVVSDSAQFLDLQVKNDSAQYKQISLVLIS